LAKPARRPPSKLVLPDQPETVAAIRVLIAAGQPHGTRKDLETQPDFAIVGEVSDGVDAVRQTVELTPDILLLDAAIAVLSGLDVLSALQRANVNVRTIIVVATGLETSVMAQMLRLGARGYVARSTSTELLFKSIRKVNAGELWIGREMMTDVVCALTAAASAVRSSSPRDFGLTRREREILTMVVEGDTNKGIARRLSVGRDTVKHHLTSIFNKTGVSSRLELALFALHHHLVDSSTN